jgi:hypothetical protein
VEGSIAPTTSVDILPFHTWNKFKKVCGSEANCFRSLLGVRCFAPFVRYRYKYNKFDTLDPPIHSASKIFQKSSRFPCLFFY